MNLNNLKLSAATHYDPKAFDQTIFGAFETLLNLVK